MAAPEDRERRPGRRGGNRERERRGKTLIEWIIERIKDLKDKIARGLRLSQQENTELQQLETDKEKLFDQLKTLRTSQDRKTRMFFQKVQGRREEVGRDLSATLSQLEALAGQQLAEKKQELETKLREARKKARELNRDEIGLRLDEDQKGVARFYVEEKVDEIERRYREVQEQRRAEFEALEETEEERPELKRELPEEEKKQMLGKLLQEQQALEEAFLAAKDPEEKARILSNLSKVWGLIRTYGFADGSAYDLTPEQKEMMKQGRKDEAFRQILSKYGLDPGRHFREVDLPTQAQWSNFMMRIFEENPHELEKYTLRFGFEEQAHNLNHFLAGHAHPADFPKLLGHFESPMLDTALREKGAVAAFRAYEQVFHRMLLVDGGIKPSEFWDPDKEESQVHHWVEHQVEETLKAYSQRFGLDYEKDFKPYKKTFLRTGWKIFLFTLRGDEIQASTAATRSTHYSPWHEDFWRRIDPPGLSMKYWKGDKPATQEAFGADRATQLTNFFKFYVGRAETKYETKEDWRRAMDELEKAGAFQLNLFGIGGILSVSDWRASMAMNHIANPKDETLAPLAPFMGIEMERKLLHGKYKGEIKKDYQREGVAEKRADELANRDAEFKARREAFAHGLERNPFGIFLSADQEDQLRVLQACGLRTIDWDQLKDLGEGRQLQALARYGLKPDLSTCQTEKEKARAIKDEVDGYNQKLIKEFFEKDKKTGRSPYDDLSQALQRLVYRQTEALKNIVSLEGTAKEKAIQEFLRDEGAARLNFDFVPGAPDDEYKKKLTDFVKAIENHFTPGSEAFERLAKKDYPFSFGTEDAPMELFRFTETGDMGLQRRFRDIGAAARATEGFWQLMGHLGLHLQKDDEVIKALKAIKDPIEEYDGVQASNQMLTLCSRMLDMTTEDRLQKILPWPLCEMRDRGMLGLATGGLTSKAEKLFGQTAMSLTKEEMRLFVEKMIGGGLFPTMDAKEVRKHLYRKHGLTRLHILGEKLWRFGPAVAVALLIAAIVAMVAKLKEGLEETTKEA